MEMKVLGLNHGQYGDIWMGLPTIRALKALHPDLSYTAHINRRFQSAAPVLLWSEDVDAVHLSDAYDNWPSPRDQAYLHAEQFDYVMHPMTPHREDQWWKIRHQTQEVAHMHGLQVTVDPQMRLTCPYPIKRTRSVAIASVGGGGAGYKSIGMELYQVIVGKLRSLGYDTIYQLTYPGEEVKCPIGVIPTNSTYEQSVLIALAAELYIGVDTGFSWLMSAFQKPTLGLYSDAYHGEFVCNIQPVNPNALYLASSDLNLISVDKVTESLHNLLT